MARSRVPRDTKTKITKLFKAGQTIPEIKAAVIDAYPKITPESIRTVVRKHISGLCDELWSKAVKIRDGNKCVISNKSSGLNSHHLIGRGNKKYRWTVENGVTLAADHHTLGNDVAAHGATDVTDRFSDWMKDNRPEQWAWFQSHRDDHEIVQVDIFQLLEISNRLKTEIEEAKSRPMPDIMARKAVRNE